MNSDYNSFKKNVKLAFSKVKEDINNLESINLNNLYLLKELDLKLQDLTKKIDKIIETQEKEQKEGFLYFSTSNKGVQSYKQTNKQTVKQLNNQSKINENSLKIDEEPLVFIKKGLEIIQKDVQNMFKTLTNQEFKVFLAIYQLEEEIGSLTFAVLAQKLGLSQQSIRNYISSLLQKKAPITKEKINNKVVILKIKPEFKNLEMLQDLLKLKEFPDSQTRLF
ncbi:MAG: HTH domain-containing protein [Candidatus Woesearchaeota archaeon]|nr:MAG: HTH domain-containing protein [Candidatus Woesearchaeota archaeon]